MPRWVDFCFDENHQPVIDAKNGPASTRRAILLAAQRFEYFLSLKNGELKSGPAERLTEFQVHD